MSIVANFDINLRGNTESIDKAAGHTGDMIAQIQQAMDKFNANTGKNLTSSESKWAKFRGAVENHGSGIGAKFGELGGKMRSAFAALPGAGVITAVLAPAVFLTKAAAMGFWAMTKGIAAATASMSLLGVATTLATGGLNLILAGVAATGAAVIGAGIAWTGMGLASMGGINEAQKAADRLGMSVESLQGFAFKGKVEIEELSDVFFKMQKAIGKGGGEGGHSGGNAAVMLGKVSKGGKSAEHALHGVAGAFAKLGLTSEKLKALKPEEQFAQIADKMEGIKNQSERAALASDIWGKKGAVALKLMKGGSAGIAESLAEARALGVIVSGNESKQVAEAAGALRMMKQAMGGLGKTAAITIAPFVKMIAESLTDAMKWVNSYRQNLIDFAYGAEFVFKNFGEYVKLYTAKATLYLTEFGNFTIHLCTDVLPQLFKSFGEMLHEAITTGFAGGFGAAWDKAVRDIKASMARTSGEFESELRGKIDANEKSLDERRRKFIEEKKAALNVPEQGESKSGGGSKDNAAVQIGSAEAFKIIAGDKGDKMFAAQNKTISVLEKIYELQRKKQAKRGPELIDVGKF